jgi:hypothetical protein
VAIYQYLQESSFGPDEIACMAAGYECVLRELHLADRKDPITEVIAKKIIELSRKGERDPAHLCAKAIKELGIPNHH